MTTEKPSGEKSELQKLKEHFYPPNNENQEKFIQYLHRENLKLFTELESMKKDNEFAEKHLRRIIDDQFVNCKKDLDELKAELESYKKALQDATNNHLKMMGEK